jgi:hypothetical protein
LKGEAAGGESNIYKVQANIDPARLLDWTGRWPSSRQQ